MPEVPTPAEVAAQRQVEPRPDGVASATRDPLDIDTREQAALDALDALDALAAVDIEMLAAEEVDLAERAALISARRDEIRQTLREALSVGTHQAGEYKVIVRAGARRVDTSAVAKTYPVEARPELYRQTVDLSAVRRHIAPADLEACTIVSPATVSVQ